MTKKYSREYIIKNAYYLDHNIKAREEYGINAKPADSDYNKEQAALDSILKKPLIKDKGAPINPFSSGNIVSMYDGKVIQRGNPYGGIE